jgi:hypothetical protein
VIGDGWNFAGYSIKVRVDVGVRVRVDVKVRISVRSL